MAEQPGGAPAPADNPVERAVGRGRNAVLAGVLLAAVMVAYLPVFGAGFIWNDDTYVTDNTTLDTVEGLKLIWTEPRANEQYYPLVFTTFWVEKHLWGLAPSGYHAVNLLLHGAGALLLWWFLRRLALRGAWLASLVFALHPVTVESVAWVTERKNVLAQLLALVAAHALLGAWTSRQASRGKRRDAGPVVPSFASPGTLYAAALLCFTLALAAKTTAGLLPAVLLVLAWWREGAVRRDHVWPLVPFFVLGIASGLHTAWLERTHVQAVGQEWALGALDRLVLAGQVVWFYLGKLLWPADLAFIYRRWVVDARVWWQWLPVVAAVGVVVGLWVLRRRLGRGPLSAALLFGGLLFPALGFFNVYPMRFSWVADHFQYHAAAALCAAAVCGVFTVAATRSPAVQRGALGAGLLLAAALGGLTFRQARVYRSEETLWQDNLRKHPECYLCLTNYGYWLEERGRVAEAVEKLELGLRIKPDNVPALLNLARIEEEQGLMESAMSRWRAAIAIDPDQTAAMLNLGNAYLKVGRIPEALAMLEGVARTSTPEAPLAHNSLGVALMRQGRASEAIPHFAEAVRLDPTFWKARANLENARARLTGRVVAGE